MAAATEDSQAGSAVVLATVGWLALALPVLAGLAFIMGNAFGLGSSEAPGTALTLLFSQPGLARSVMLSLGVGLLTTLIAFCLCVLICAHTSRNASRRPLVRLLLPALALPHAAFAIGFAFLLSPSGWIARAISPWLTGWSSPPDLLIVQDTHGLALSAGLILKELVFLLIAAWALLPRLQERASLDAATVLGYSPTNAWVKTVLPRLYPQMRFPLYAVLAYSMSVVDMAQVLGPTTPPLLAVRVMAWLRDPDPAMQQVGAAGACLQMLLVGLAIGGWRLAERGAIRLGQYWIARGPGPGRGRRFISLPRTILFFVSAVYLLAMAGQLLWSLAGVWRFPAFLPSSVSVSTWQTIMPTLTSVIVTTVFIGGVTAAFAVALAVLTLETQQRSLGALTLLLYLPLLIPQVSFLPGLQTLFLFVGLDGSVTAVIGSHLLFVFPYVYLLLAAPFRDWNPDFGRMAATLGASRQRILWRIKLPMLLAPLCLAVGVGFAISVGQYVSTLMLGAGRVPTLTTEVMALASGGDRREVGIVAVTQMLLPLLAYAMAVTVPAALYRNRLDMRAAT